MSNAYKILRDNMRAPVVETTATDKLYNDFVANTSDSWLTFTKDLVANAKYNLGLDEMGRVIFLPDQDAASLQPVWTYTDDNSSILYPDISLHLPLETLDFTGFITPAVITTAICSR